MQTFRSNANSKSAFVTMRRVVGFFGAMAVLFTLMTPMGWAQEGGMYQDRYQWLEAVDSPQALSWVHEHNAQTKAHFDADRQFQSLVTKIRQSMESDQKIPGVQKIGHYYYNFWKDHAHQHGLLRRTTLREYRKVQPKWENVLDLDQLSQQEGENWVWHGIDCLRPKYQRCFINLSRAGSDADVSREFDLKHQQFVVNGFYRPEAKGGMQWIDQNTVFVFTDFGPGSMTDSGYPRLVKRWKRGTPLASAALVYQGDIHDRDATAIHLETKGYQRDLIVRSRAFYDTEVFVLEQNDQLKKIEVPNSAEKYFHQDWLAIQLREPWTVLGQQYPAGSLLVTRLSQFLQGRGHFQVLYTPQARRSLVDVVWVRSHVVLNWIDDLKSRLTVMTWTRDGWKSEEVAGLSPSATIVASAVDQDDCDDLWLTSTDFLTPTSLSLLTIGQKPQLLKQLPEFFDSSRFVVEQQFAKSADGTQVPYFLIRAKTLQHTGDNPTLLYGYGGFEVSLLPAYSATVGRAWLEQGGTYVVANIRGGGEYGPQWHQAALRENRHKAYEDMAAVARHLVASKITSPKYLGMMGGSNGGLLAGNLLVQYPELFGAFVIQVPLLDMKRYTHLLAGASWISEYGDPDTKDWSFIQTFSPYHLFDPHKQYPPVLFLTSTRDDRVHPAHARKMAARMLAAKKDVTFYENTDGGHAGAANSGQAAYMAALAYRFLWERLSPPGTQSGTHESQ